MKTHIIFVEPAQYTVDLKKNVYKDEEVTFLNSDSKAKFAEDDILREAYLCDQHHLIANIKHFLRIGLKNDFIIINGYDHWSFIFLYLISFFKKLFIGIESDTPYRETYGLKKTLKTFYLKTIFSKKNILGLPGGKGSHRQLFLNYGMAEERVFVLPMMIDNEKFYVPEKKKLEEHSIFLFVGRLIPEKNIQLLIKAFKATFENKRNAKLLIVGTGECEEDLKIINDGYENIRFTGAVFGNDLINYFHSADILILPSVLETWGLVINEAMSSHLAIICSSAVGAAEDLVVAPISGWVFESENQRDLEKVLLYCAENYEEVSKRADNGYQFMKTTWNYDYYIHNLNKVKEYVRTH